MHRGFVALLLFFSGGCALVYQTAWLREFRLVFGASTAATSAVVAIFMGGLGFGGLLFGRRADRHPSPLAMYGNLELLIAASAALTPILVLGVRKVYLFSGGLAVLGLFPATAVRLLLAAAVLAIPTLLMGGTLPAAARAVERDRDATRRDLALIYGLNTVGAVAGTLISTFALLEILGTRRTLWAAAMVNGLVGITARAFARTRPAAPAAVEQEPAGEGTRSPRAFVLAAAAVVGFAFLLMELVWYRLLAPLLGGSTFTFGLILALALLGVGLGGLGYSAFGRTRVSLGHLAATCGIEALLLAVPFALGDRIAVLALLLRPVGAIGFSGLMLGWCLIAAIVVVPPAIAAGYQFPLLIALLGRGREEVGRHVGLGYMWNTAGAIAGSLAGGFGLLPAFGAVNAWRLVVVVLLVLCACALVVQAIGGRALRPLFAGALMIVLSLPLLFARGPTAAWRHSGIGAGRAGQFEPSANGIRDWVQRHRRVTSWESDGVESSVALNRENGLSFIISGKNDGNARMDAGTQVMGGILGCLLQPSVRRALVVGMGTGSTSGWLAEIPAMEIVHTVELERDVLHVALACEAVNRNVLSNPKVKVTIADAREVLLTIPEEYDLIFSEPSNPYRAGIASLFTLEFYQAASRRLRSGGLFIQWLQAYEVDGPTVQTVLGTLLSVFPAVEVWQSKPGDLLLVAAPAALAHDVAEMRRAIATEPFRSALFNGWRVTDLEGVLARFVAGGDLVAAIGGAPGVTLNTDDRNVVEFGFARSVGAAASFDVPWLREQARLHGADRPRLYGGSVDWQAVLDRRLSMMTAEKFAPLALAESSPERQRRRAAHAAWVATDPAGVIKWWERQPQPPGDPVELAMVAESLAERGDPRALPMIEQIGKLNRGEANAILALAQLRRGEVGEGADSLVKSFTEYRRDPWPLVMVMERALITAEEIAQQDVDGSLSSKLYSAMKEPFAAYLFDEDRRMRLIKIAARTGGDRCNARVIEALHAIEPEVPWRREFLEVRAGCYARAKDPLAARARRDLQDFISNEVERTVSIP